MKKTFLLFASVLAALLTASIALAQLPPGDTEPAMAFDPGNNRCLAIYRTSVVSPAELSVHGQLVKPDGSLIATPFSLSTSTNADLPRVAFDTTFQDYLAAWNQPVAAADLDLVGQLIANNGLLTGSMIPISSASAGDQFCADLAFDSANDRFLVVWVDTRSGPNHIFGQLVNADGSLRGSNFVIYDASSVDADYCAAVAFDSSLNRFLVVWSDQSSGTSDVYGQLVNADGTLQGARFAVSTPSAPNAQRDPSVVFDTTNKRYLAAWEDERSGGNFNIFGQIVNGDGTLTGSNVQLTNEGQNQIAPVAAFDSVLGRYLLAWNFTSNGADYFAHGLYLNADATPAGAGFAISTVATEGFVKSAVVYNNLCQNYLVSYPILTAPTTLRFTVVGNPCETVPPTVTTTSPAANAVDVTLNTAVLVTFSEAMRLSTINANSVLLRDSAGNSVAGAVSYDAATLMATFLPTSPLANSATYTATITPDATDLVGNALAAAVTWSFTTVAAPPQPGGCSLMPQHRR